MVRVMYLSHLDVKVVFCLKFQIGKICLIDMNNTSSYSIQLSYEI